VIGGATSQILVSSKPLNLHLSPPTYHCNAPFRTYSSVRPKDPSILLPPTNTCTPFRLCDILYLTYPPLQPPVHWMQPAQHTPQVGNPLIEFQFRNTFASGSHEMPPRMPLGPRTGLQSSINTPTSSMTSQKRQAQGNPPGPLCGSSRCLIL
jgi:hypothetical protein